MDQASGTELLTSIYMNSSSQQSECPSPWVYNNTKFNGIMTCKRPRSQSGSCSPTLYTTSRQYSRVCGRAIGYQIGGTDAFFHLADSQPIDSAYVYGVSITHGTPRNHIWTYAAGVSEGLYMYQDGNCPCSNLSHPDSEFPPMFVGDNYFRESGNLTNFYTLGLMYSSDPLWDSQQCEGECCSNEISPSWFSAELPNPTTDDIEVRICVPEGSQDDDIAVQVLELYVQ